MVNGIPHKDDEEYGYYIEEARRFLERIWFYDSTEAQCYVLVWICKEGLRYWHYCLDITKNKAIRDRRNRVTYCPNYWDLYEAIVKDLEKPLPGLEKDIMPYVFPSTSSLEEA